MSINWGEARTKPHRMQQIVGEQIRTFWMVRIIHEKIVGEVFLGSNGTYIETDSKEDAAAKGAE